MQDEPTLTELTKAVVDFLRADIAPKLDGHASFKLRVACNALDLVVRQLSVSETSDAAEHHRIALLLGTQGTLGELNALLCARIGSGEMDLTSPGLADHLWQTTLEKLAVDQPGYASYRREMGRQT